jgi:hypothetical protein
VTINAINFDCVSWLSIKLPVTMSVLHEVAIDAMHSLFQVNVCQVNRLAELVRIVKRNNIPFGVQELPVAVVLIDRAENPSMAVEVGELGVLERLIEFRSSRLL